MSTFKGHAKSLGEQYVFYQRLLTDRDKNGQLFYLNLGKYVSSTSYRILSQTKKYAADASAVRAQAQAEFSKEKMLLESKFQVKLSFNKYEGTAGFKEVIDALNACLNLKEVYQRNVQLIKNTKMKGVFSWYPTYFMHAWEEKWPSIRDQFNRAFSKGGEASVILGNILDKVMPDICVLGLQKMLDGPEVEHKSIDPQLKTAYSSLINQIGSVSQAGSMAQQIYQAYQLDELKKSLIENLKLENGKLYAKNIKPKTKEIVSMQIHQRGGLSLEAIESAIFSQIGSQVKDAKSIHSGSKGIKADNILTIGINPTIVAEALEEAGANRDENIQALSELGNKLSKLDDGFIIYSSDKNYTLNSDFSGFSAGSLGTSASDFLNNVYKTSTSVSTLIGAIQQLGDGAMLAHKEAEFENLLAQDVAYMLFDDFSTIGVVSENSGNAIHIMNLNGIMMPMSVILSMLADAIESVSKEEIRKLVSVNINAPAILYKEQKDQEEAFPGNSHAAWEYQKQYALENTQITAKFLKNFKSFVQSIL